MAYGVYAKNAIQLGDEATPGTQVLTTVVWPGEFSDITDQGVTEIVPSHEGLLAPTLDAMRLQELSQLDFPDSPLAFETIVYPLDSGIMTATPSGAGPYTRTYTFPVNTDAAIDTYTVEAGNELVPESVYQFKFGFTRMFSLSARINEAWRLASWQMQGQRKDPSYVVGSSGTRGFSGGAATPDGLERMIANATSLWIDNSGVAIGTTPITGVLQEFSMQVDTGLRPVFSMDGGVLYYTAIKRIGIPLIPFTIAYELEDSSVAEDERAAYEARAVRIFRLLCTGTGGRVMSIGAAGKYLSFDPYQNVDGNTVIRANGVFGYSPVDTRFCAITVTNNQATLP
jgi:hypothetical protein